MTPDELNAIFEQHARLMSEISDVYIALAVVAFIGLFFLVCMFGLAAWSVHTVNARQRDLEAKFTLLIDVLLQGIHRDIEAKQVAVTGERVDVHGST